jgi:exonuclease 3'-5' domain-containing protein 1
MASQIITSTVQMIDSISSLEKLLNELNYYSHKPIALFLDVQTINPGEDRSILIISLFVQLIKKVFLIDVLTLGNDIFIITSLTDNSLKLLLKSSAALKILFNVRNTSAGLFNHYRIHLNGIKDLQVMQVMTQYLRAQQAQAARLESCIEKEAREAYRHIASQICKLR